QRAGVDLGDRVLAAVGDPQVAPLRLAARLLLTAPIAAVGNGAHVEDRPVAAGRGLVDLAGGRALALGRVGGAARALPGGAGITRLADRALGRAGLERVLRLRITAGQGHRNTRQD